jgi:hypothetical protein
MPQMPKMDYPDYAERTLSELNATIDVGSISRDFPRMSVSIDPPPAHLTAPDDALASPPPAWIWRRSELAMAPADDTAPAAVFDDPATSEDDDEDVRAAIAGAATAGRRAAGQDSAASGSRRGRKLCGTLLRLFELRRMCAAAAPTQSGGDATHPRLPAFLGASPTPHVARAADGAHDDAPVALNPFATADTAGAGAAGARPPISHNSPFGVHAHGAVAGAAGLECTSPFRTSDAVPYDPACDSRRAHFAEIERVMEERASLLTALRLQIAAWGADADMSSGMRELMAAVRWWEPLRPTDSSAAANSNTTTVAASSSNAKVPCDGATPMLRFLWCFSQSVVFFASRRVSSLFELPFAEHLSDVEWVVRVLTEPWLERESRLAREVRAAATTAAERGVFVDGCMTAQRQPASTTTSETGLLRGGSAAGACAGVGYGTLNDTTTPANRDGSMAAPTAAAMLAVSPVVGAPATNTHTPASVGSQAAASSAGKIYICHEITSRNLVPAEARAKIPQFYVSWVLQLTVDARTGAAVAAEIVGTRVYRVRLPVSAQHSSLFKRIFSCCFSDEAAADAQAMSHAPRQQQEYGSNHQNGAAARSRSRTPAGAHAASHDEMDTRRRGRSATPQPPTMSTIDAAGAPPQAPLHPATYDGDTTKAERSAMTSKYRKNVAALEACARDRFADVAPVPVFAVTALHVPHIVLRQVQRDSRHREFTQYHMHNSTL